MPQERQLERTRAELSALSHRGLDVSGFFDAVAARLHRAIPFDGACWVTMDPATLLVTSHVQHGPFEPDDVPRLAHYEYRAEDILQWPTLARDGPVAATLREATGSSIERSPRYREMLDPNGIGDELRAAFMDGSTCWGATALYRERGRASYTPAERDFLASIAGDVAAGLRRAIVLGELRFEESDGPGLVVLRDDNSVDAITAAAERWLAPLFRSQEGLPAVVYAVASRTRRISGGRDASTTNEARARIQTPSGQWLVLVGSLLETPSGIRTAVIVQPARGPEIAPLLLEAYRLTERERDIVHHVIQGSSTKEIALTLFVSPYTVQDHLKAIFDKIGVRSRRELLAQIFTQHYAPRIARGYSPGTHGWFSDQANN
jgi:DNA-binding CsgD family transcriptional regulator